MRFKRGISTIISSQNSRRTLEASIRSFAAASDEVIVVDNRSTDGSQEIAQRLQAKISNVAFIDAPEVAHLHENRQIGLNCATYEWVVRADSDWVLDSDRTSAAGLNWRETILRESQNPLVHSRSVNNYNFIASQQLVRASSYANELAPYVPPFMTRYRWRVLRNTSLLKFVRRGRWETVRMRHLYALLELPIETPFIAHYAFKTDLDHFLRSERTNWRERGDFIRYPSVEHYVRERYNIRGTQEQEMQSLAAHYVKSQIYPALELAPANHVSSSFTSYLH